MLSNWLGQTLEVGDWVYRGARDGNSSSFKIGVITKIDEGRNKVRVNWLYEPLTLWDVDKNMVDAVRKMNSAGSPDVDSLVRITPDINFLDEQCEKGEAVAAARRKEWQERNANKDLTL